MTTHATFRHIDWTLGESQVRSEVKPKEVKPKFEDLRLRIERLLHEIFQGHDEFLGMTPD